MSLRAPTMFPGLQWRRDPRAVEHDQEFIDNVMGRWDRKQDTAHIAQAMMESEAAVAVALRCGREQRRAGCG